MCYKRTLRYRRSKRVKVAAAKRATQAQTQRKHQQSSGADLTASKNRVPASEQEAHKQDSGVASESVTCDACKRIFGSAQALTSHLKESHRCPGSSRYQPLSEEPARRVLKRSEASDALQQIQAMAGTTMGDKEPEDVPALRRLYIDFAHSISIGVHREK